MAYNKTDDIFIMPQEREASNNTGEVQEAQKRFTAASQAIYLWFRGGFAADGRSIGDLSLDYIDENCRAMKAVKQFVNNSSTKDYAYHLMGVVISNAIKDYINRP